MIIITSFARVMVIVIRKFQRWWWSRGFWRGLNKKSLTIVFILIRMNENTWKPIALCLGATGTDWLAELITKSKTSRKNRTFRNLTRPPPTWGCYSLTSIWIHFLFVSKVFDKTMEVRNSKYKARSLIMRIFIQREQDVSVSSSWLSWEPR